MKSPRRHGFTLIEVMVVSAIAAVLLVTAASLLVTMSSQRAANRKRLDRLSESFTAMTLLERSILNGGYHFPSARFGFRVYDNVTAGSTYGGYSVAASCAGPGCIVPNTDVLELVEGAAPQPSLIANSLPDASTINVVPASPGGPIYLADAGPGEFLFMFGASDGGNCAAIGHLVDTFPSNGVGFFQVRLVDRDLATVSQSGYYSVAAGATNHSYNCPTNTFQMTASVATVRHLYFVMADDGGTRGLYQEDLSPLTSVTGATGDAGTLTMLARGIDNFQVIPLALQSGSGFTVGCTNGICDCNIGGSCSFTGVSGSDPEFGVSGRIVGVRIGLTSRGETDDRLPAVVVPPRLANETMPADNVKRTPQTQTYMLRNFAQVSP